MAAAGAAAAGAAAAGAAAAEAPGTYSPGIDADAAKLFFAAGLKPPDTTAPE